MCAFRRDWRPHPVHTHPSSQLSFPVAWTTGIKGCKLSGGGKGKMAYRAASLSDIATAAASPAEAREVVRSVFGQPTPDLLRETYYALRSWVWKALDQRRRDPDLRAWRGIIEAASTLMANNGQISLSEKTAALGELVREWIAVGKNLGAVDLTRRQHVTEALGCLAAKGGRARRADLGEHLGLAQCNLTRVLNMMSAAGLVERSTLGKEAIFELSRAGEAVQAKAAPSTFAAACGRRPTSPRCGTPNRRNRRPNPAT